MRCGPFIQQSKTRIPSDSKAWMKSWTVANKLEMKDLAEKCTERIAVGPMMELPAYNQRASEGARKEAMCCLHQKINKSITRIFENQSEVQTSI